MCDFDMVIKISVPSGYQVMKPTSSRLFLYLLTCATMDVSPVVLPA